jgi:CheY-like chemotaxis protein
MESVGRLAGGVAHDFNNLLTVVKGNSALLLRLLPPSSPGREWLMEIGQATDRGAGLIRQLLAFARRQPVEPRIFDLNELVGTLEPILRRLLGESVGFEWRPAPGRAWVRADPSRIEQVIINLVTNARDAMPNGGRCAIATVIEPAESPANRGVRLTVADTGVGMSDEVQARVFEPFFTTKPPGFGTGLGLATTYGAVEQAGGHVSVASRLQVGTTFTVTLPVAEPPEQSAAASAAATPAGGSEMIMVVEDEPRVRRVASRTLARHGYRVVEAADGIEALDLLARTPGVACIVSDVVMPRLGGGEFARRLQERYPSIPVVFTSGYTGDFEPPATGTTAFLQKPYTPDDLAATVRRLIDRARSP